MNSHDDSLEGAAEDILRAQDPCDDRFRLVAEVLPVIVWMVSPDWRTVEYVNPAFERIYQRSAAELYANPGLWITAIHPEDRDRVVDYFRAHHGLRTEQEYRIIDGNGQVRWIRDITTPIRNAEGDLRHLAGFAEDISDRIQARGEVERALQHTELLLRELHHRVKNNLQIISGLLEIAADADLSHGRALADIRTRIGAMAVIHDRLFAAENPARITAQSFFESIVEHLYSAWAPRDCNCSVAVEVRDLELTVDTAVPCGLILSELVSNSFKHAFSFNNPKTDATVEVRLLCPASGSLVLHVSDNGRGLPAGLDWRKSTSIGLQLVDSLARQLHATVEVSRVRGTSFAVKFEERAPG